MTDLRSIALVILLTGCSRMTQPSDITVALELCSQRGGYSHVARYQAGKNLLINCKDGTAIDVLLPEGKK